MNNITNESNLLPIDNIHEYIHTLQQNYSKYYCLYIEACKQLKKCLETKEEISHKLSVVENLHSVSDRNRYILQGKLNSCLDLKDNLEKMLLIKSQTKQNQTLCLDRISKMPQEHLEKLENLQLKQKLYYQNLRFERYEKFDFPGRTNFPLSSNTSTPLPFEEPWVMDTSETSKTLYNDDQEIKKMTSIALEGEEADRIALVESLRDELYQLGTTFQTKETAWCQAEQEKDEKILELTNQNTDLKQLVSDLSADNNYKQEAIIKFDEEYKILEKDQISCMNTLRKSSEQLSEISKENAELKSVQNQQEIKISNYEMNIGKMTEMLTDQSRKMEETNKLNNHLTEINLDLKSQLEEVNKTSQEKMLEMETKLDMVKNANRKYISQVINLKTKLEESENLCQQLKNENSIFQEENNHLKTNASTVKALQLTIDDLKINIEKSHADYLALKGLTDKNKAAYLFQIENLKTEIEYEKIERIKTSNQLEISNNSLALISKTMRNDQHLKTLLNQFIIEINDSISTILTSTLVTDVTSTTDTITTIADHDYSFSLNTIKDKVKNLVENYNLSIELNSFLEETELKLTANNKTLQDSNQVLSIKNRKMAKQLKQVKIAYNVLKEKAAAGKQSLPKMFTVASKYRKLLSNEMAVTTKYKKLNLKLKFNINDLNSQIKVLTMKNNKLYNYFDQVQNKIKNVHQKEMKMFELKNTLYQELDNLRFIYENLHNTKQTTKMSNLLDDPDETGLKFIRYYYQTVLKYLHREYIKTHPECVQSLLNEIRNLTIKEKNQMIYSSLGKITLDNIHQYYTNILNKLEIEINNKTEEISHVVTESIDYKLNLDRLNLPPTTRLEETEIAFLKNIQKNQRLDELEDLRVIEAKYHLLDYFMKFLFYDYQDILTLVKVLQKSVLVLEQNDIKGLLDFIISEGISFSSFKGYYQTIQNLISFFKQDVGFTFFPEDVNSLINILKDFGGHAFVQSLKDIILLKKTYPEYESLFTVFNDLKNHYTSTKLFHFNSILQLVFEIHKSFPDEIDIEHLKLQFLETCMIKKYGINGEQLMNLLALEKLPGDRVDYAFDEKGKENDEELRDKLPEEEEEEGEFDEYFEEYEFEELEEE